MLSERDAQSVDRAIRSAEKVDVPRLMRDRSQTVLEVDVTFMHLEHPDVLS